MSTLDVDFDAMLADLQGVEIEHMKDSLTIATMNPRDALQYVTVDQIIGGYGLRKGDWTLTSKEVLRDPDVREIEQATRKKLQDKRRKAIKRRRARRIAEEKEREARPINQVRLGAAWAIVETCIKPITKITVPIYNRFQRVMGDTDLHDCSQNVATRLAEYLARHEADLREIAEAAIWLHSAPLPYEAKDGPEGARLLLGAITTIAHRTIVDTYRSKTCSVYVTDMVTGETVRKDVTMESFDLIETMAANTHGVDTLIANSKARIRPKFESKPPTGELTRLFAKTAIDAWITDRDLDWCADLMISDEHTRTDGSFKWTENASLIFDGFGIPVGDISESLMAGYAKRAVRLAFKELPEVILTVRGLSSDPRFMWDVLRHRLQIDRMGTSKAMLTQEILLESKPHALAAAIDMLERDLDEVIAPVQWRRRGDIVLVPSLDDHVAAQNRGLRVFLEGQEEGTAPTRFYDGPDETEFRKILRSEPSEYRCKHGIRTHVVGVTKRPYKSSRVWSGDFCSLEKNAPEACDPVFSSNPKGADVVWEKV